MGSVNYSIIIPHKNIPELLRRCLDSIPKREDVQIIIVDDNSSPDLVDFECFPGMGEPGIEVYLTKEGRGAGYARNVGLKHAKGKWLLFADADDYYADSFLDSLDAYYDSNYDLIYYSVFSDVTGENDRACTYQEFYERYFSGALDLSHFKYMTWAPWNKMFRREYIESHGICFEEIPIGNDAFFSLRAAEGTDKILVLRDELYCVTYNERSITFSHQESFQKQMDYLSVNLRISKFLKEHRILYAAVHFGQYLKTFGLLRFVRFLLEVVRQDSLFFQLSTYLKVKRSGSFLIPL